MKKTGKKVLENMSVKEKIIMLWGLRSSVDTSYKPPNDIGWAEKYFATVYKPFEFSGLALAFDLYFDIQNARNLTIIIPPGLITFDVEKFENHIDERINYYEGKL